MITITKAKKGPRKAKSFVYVGPVVHKRLKELSDKSGRPMTHILRMLIEQAVVK